MERGHRLGDGLLTFELATAEATPSSGRGSEADGPDDGCPRRGDPEHPRLGIHGSAPSPPDDLLTAREREVIALMVQGRSNRDIAEKLHLAPDTVKAQVARLLRKLGASNRAEAVGRYLTMRVDGD